MARGHAVYASLIGPLLGTWSNSKTLTYRVYALDFQVSGGGAIFDCGRWAHARTFTAISRWIVPEVLLPGPVVEFEVLLRDGAGWR